MNEEGLPELAIGVILAFADRPSAEKLALKLDKLTELERQDELMLALALVFQRRFVHRRPENRDAMLAVFGRLVGDL